MLYFLYLTFGEFCECYIFVELRYFEFGLKCMHFFWDIKNLFLDGWYYIIDLIFIKYFNIILNFWTSVLSI